MDDVVVVGGGPWPPPDPPQTAGRRKPQVEVSVVVLEKAPSRRPHPAAPVMDPIAITELFPDWNGTRRPAESAGHQRRLLFLDETGARFSRPHCGCPTACTTKATTSSAWGAVTKWMASRPGWASEIFPASPPPGALRRRRPGQGVAAGNMGVGKDGEPGDEFQLGMELHGKLPIFAEGARGHLGKQLIARFQLDDAATRRALASASRAVGDPPERHQRPVVHTAGWPLDATPTAAASSTTWKDNKVALGFVVGLDYPTPGCPVRRIPALEEHPPGSAPTSKAASASLRRSRHHRRRHPQACPRPCSRRRADRLRRRLPERPASKGSHAAIKTGMLAPKQPSPKALRPAASTTSWRLPQGLRASWLPRSWTRRATGRGSSRARWPLMHRHRACMAAAQAGREEPALDAAGTQARPWPEHAPAAGRQAIDYPKPGRQADLRPLSARCSSGNTNHEETSRPPDAVKDAAGAGGINLAPATPGRRATTARPGL